MQKISELSLRHLTSGCVQDLLGEEAPKSRLMEQVFAHISASEAQLSTKLAELEVL